jgi:hypothetical protein
VWVQRQRLGVVCGSQPTWEGVHAWPGTLDRCHSWGVLAGWVRPSCLTLFDAVRSQSSLDVLVHALMSCMEYPESQVLHQDHRCRAGSKYTQPCSTYARCFAPTARRACPHLRKLG